MKLGAFLISLAVKDLEASRKFYEKFGFTVSGGDASQNWLFFQPRVGPECSEASTFTDVRDLQRKLKAQGVSFWQEADEQTTGPASFIAVDPDGNPILAINMSDRS